MLTEAVAPGTLDTYRNAARAAFLAKADIDVPDEVLEALPAAKASFAGPAAAQLAEEVASLFGRMPRAVEYLPHEGTFHAVFRIEAHSAETFYARTSVPTIPWPALDFAVDAWVSERLRDRGVPAPVVRHVDLSRGRLPFDVEIVEASPGEPLEPGPRVLGPGASGPEADDSVCALGAAVAAVHSVGCRGFGPLDPTSLEAEGAPQGLHQTWRDFILLRLDEHVAACRGVGALTSDEAAAVRAAFAEAEPLFDRTASVLLHGDLGNRNVLVSNGRVAALLDWEDSLAGDPVFDVAGWGTFVGNHDRREAFLDGYRTLSGEPDEFERRYSLYYLRILLAKTVHRLRFGYSRTDRIPAAERLRPALGALRAHFGGSS